MNRDEIRSRLLEILSSGQFASLQVDVSRLTDASSLLNDIPLDSLQLLEFIVAMEKTFGFAANTKRLNIDIFDRFARVIDFVEEQLATVQPSHFGGSHVATNA
jgi:acyl carrier protein